MDIVDKTASIIIPFFFSSGIKRKCRKIPPLNYLYILRAFIIYIALCNPSLIAYHFSIGFVVFFSIYIAAVLILAFSFRCV